MNVASSVTQRLQPSALMRLLRKLGGKLETKALCSQERVLLEVNCFSWGEPGVVFCNKTKVFSCALIHSNQCSLSSQINSNSLRKGSFSPQIKFQKYFIKCLLSFLTSFISFLKGYMLRASLPITIWMRDGILVILKPFMFLYLF